MQDAFITKCKQNIAALEAQRAAIIANGQSYSIGGSHSVTQVRLAEIDAALRAERKKIELYLGGSRSGGKVYTRYE